MTSLNQWKTWVKRLGYAETPRAERRLPAGFTALRRGIPDAKASAVKDISTTGLQIVTEERWPIGELETLTIRAEKLSDDPQEPQVTVQAKVARHTGDGIGLAFILPEGMDHGLWELLLKNVVTLQGVHDALVTLKVLRTVLFLSKLCHEGARDAIFLLNGELDRHRTERAMEIARRAEVLVEKEPDADKKRAEPKLITSILRFGSWSDGFLAEMWAGLLATSCTLDGTDVSNEANVHLMVGFSASQSRILLSTCRLYLERKKDSEFPRVVQTPKQMIRLSGVGDPQRIASDCSYLFDKGLIEKNFNFPSYIVIESFDITPTALALQFYERCMGNSINLAAPQSDSGGGPSLPHPFAVQAGVAPPA